jgi:hypothetical protein
MPQSKRFVACDIDQIPLSNTRWSERTAANEMDQVRELLALIDRRRLDGVIVASNFVFWRVQPSKERTHPGFEFQGETDGTREVPEEIDQEEAKWRLAMMFNLRGISESTTRRGLSA